MHVHRINLNTLFFPDVSGFSVQKIAERHAEYEGYKVRNYVRRIEAHTFDEPLRYADDVIGIVGNKNVHVSSLSSVPILLGPAPRLLGMTIRKVALK